MQRSLSFCSYLLAFQSEFVTTLLIRNCSFRHIPPFCKRLMTEFTPPKPVLMFVLNLFPVGAVSYVRESWDILKKCHFLLCTKSICTSEQLETFMKSECFPAGEGGSFLAAVHVDVMHTEALLQAVSFKPTSFHLSWHFGPDEHNFGTVCCSSGTVFPNTHQTAFGKDKQGELQLSESGPASTEFKIYKLFLRIGSVPGTGIMSVKSTVTDKKSNQI